MSHVLTSVAKHLEPLKGGKFPLEVLIRGKDAEQNEKLFTKITDVIKSSGVRFQWKAQGHIKLTFTPVEESWCTPKR